MINDVKNLLIFLLDISTSSFEKYLFKFFAYFLNKAVIVAVGVIFVVMTYLRFLYILDINPLTEYSL